MTFDALKAGDAVFIDANVFIYHCNGISSDCKQFLSRCSDKNIAGYSATFTLAEVLHRFMIAEAVRKKYIRSKNPVKQLKKHPEIITHLSDYSADVASIQTMNITILDLTQKTLHTSEAIRNTEGLLTNDSLLLAVMKQANLTKLATNDNDFDHIRWLDLYKPADV